MFKLKDYVDKVDFGKNNKTQKVFIFEPEFLT